MCASRCEAVTHKLHARATRRRDSTPPLCLPAHAQAAALNRNDGDLLSLFLCIATVDATLSSCHNVAVVAVVVVVVFCQTFRELGSGFLNTAASLVVVVRRHLCSILLLLLLAAAAAASSAVVECAHRIIISHRRSDGASRRQSASARPTITQRARQSSWSFG